MGAASAVTKRDRPLGRRDVSTDHRRGGRPTELAVRQEGSPATPRLIVTATPSLGTMAERRHVRSIVESLLGSRIDLRNWYRLAEADRRLRPLAARFRGVKPPRFPTIFEALVNGFACQQLSLVVGLELLNRLAVLCDVRRGTGRHATYAFPGPHDVARLPPSSYQGIGFSRQKVRALLALARDIDRHDIDFGGLTQSGADAVRAALLERRGVGRWTAEYVLLRGLGRLQVFPGDDVGAQKSPMAWALGAVGLRGRQQSRREMAAIRGHGVLPPPARRLVEGG